jgi:hypothetical protein
LAGGGEGEEGGSRLSFIDVVSPLTLFREAYVYGVATLRSPKMPAVATLLLSMIEATLSPRMLTMLLRYLLM